MDVPGTAIEQYFNQLIRLRLLSQVVVSDRQGNTVLACFGPSAPTPGSVSGGSGYTGTPTAPPGGDDGEEESVPIESNVVLSGARCYQHLDQLGLGQPAYVSAQYHDAVVVQTVDHSVLLTLIGARSQGHSTGSILALLPQVKGADVYQELLRKVEECYQ